MMKDVEEGIQSRVGEDRLDKDRESKDMAGYGQYMQARVWYGEWGRIGRVGQGGQDRVRRVGQEVGTVQEG